MRLLLARHGQTDWNDAGRFQGMSDIPLNATGLEQARLLAERLKDERIDAIYSSVLSRAHKTALKVAEGRDVKVVVREDLNERTYGKWDGLTEEQIKEQYSDDFDAYCKRRYSVAPTNGESIAQITQRVSAFLEMLQKDQTDVTVLVVTHSGTLRGLMDGLLEYSPEEVADLRFKHTSLTSITFVDGKPTLDFMNSVDHLEGSDEKRNPRS
ncbi:MAG: histidine phosphatase family protein [Nanoarchaeota archaeon]|nr:histidine phosphatase family protein [Nanoarchaeota archaeon]